MSLSLFCYEQCVTCAVQVIFFNPLDMGDVLSHHDKSSQMMGDTSGHICHDYVTASQTHSIVECNTYPCPALPKNYPTKSDFMPGTVGKKFNFKQANSYCK